MNQTNSNHPANSNWHLVKYTQLQVSMFKTNFSFQMGFSWRTVMCTARRKWKGEIELLGWLPPMHLQKRTHLPHLLARNCCRHGVVLNLKCTQGRWGREGEKLLVFWAPSIPSFSHSPPSPSLLSFFLFQYFNLDSWRGWPVCEFV